MTNINEYLYSFAEKFLKLTLAEEKDYTSNTDLTYTIWAASIYPSNGIPNFTEKIKELNVKYPNDTIKSLTINLNILEKNTLVSSVVPDPLSASITADPQYASLLSGLTTGIPAYFAKRNPVAYSHGPHSCVYRIPGQY